jgi:hypothetical protein
MPLRALQAYTSCGRANSMCRQVDACDCGAVCAQAYTSPTNYTLLGGVNPLKSHGTVEASHAHILLSPATTPSQGTAVYAGLYVSWNGTLARGPGSVDWR